MGHCAKPLFSLQQKKKGKTDKKITKQLIGKVCINATTTKHKNPINQFDIILCHSEYCLEKIGG